MNIKTKLITTGKATILVVDLPEGAFDVGIDNSILYYRHGMMINSAIDLVDMYGKWQPLGFLNEIKEEVAAGLVKVESEKDYFLNCTTYTDYTGFNDAVTSARTSLHSLIASEVCLVNPLGDDNEFDKYVFNHSESHFKAWLEAEDKVYKNPIILLKKN